MPGAGEPWFEPVRGALVDALTGDASVRGVVDGRVRFEAADARWRRSRHGFDGSVLPAVLYGSFG